MYEHMFIHMFEHMYIHYHTSLLKRKRMYLGFSFSKIHCMYNICTSKCLNKRLNINLS